MTLNMKVPESQSRKTKTEAESNTQVRNFQSKEGGQITAITQEAEELEHDYSSKNHCIDAVDVEEDLDEDAESNYITNGSYA